MKRLRMIGDAVGNGNKNIKSHHLYQFSYQAVHSNIDKIRTYQAEHMMTVQ